MSAIYHHKQEEASVATGTNGRSEALPPGISIGRIALATVIAVVSALGAKAVGIPATWAIAIGAAIGGCTVAVLHGHFS
jgi:hypothetical protein